ncbi:hypothetical protein BLA29_011420, partial [Euroglyphus maynei]
HDQPKRIHVDHHHKLDRVDIHNGKLLHSSMNRRCDNSMDQRKYHIILGNVVY